MRHNSMVLPLATAAAMILLSAANCMAEDGEAQTEKTASWTKEEKDGISGITVEPVEPVTYSGSADTFVASDAYRDWWQDAREKAKVSMEYRDDMDAFYGAVIPAVLKASEDSAVCSPLNLYMALSLLAETAGGNSREQILKLLGASDTDALSACADALWTANSQDMPLLKSLPANSLWLSDDFSFHEETLEHLADAYHASSYRGEMGTEAMDEALRSWVNEQTKDLLKEYADQLTTDPRMILGLVSTLYYKAAWDLPFLAENTRTETFHGAKGDTECEMMHWSDSGAYYWGEGFGAVSRSIANGGSMFFILPDEGTELDEVLESAEVMSLINDQNHYENNKYLTLNLSIPKFEVKANTELTPLLRSLGITDVFDPEAADFSPLTEEEGVFLSTAEHAACVSIDEEGVTGAAYTDMFLMGAGMPPEEQVDFVLDRPFFFVVTGRDRSVLFAGTVKDIAP